MWIVTSFLLGAAFLGEHALRVARLRGSHHGPALNAYWSLFFIMTGIHGLHVALGLVAMIFLLGRMGGKAVTPARPTCSRRSGTTGTSSTSCGSASSVACSS